MCCMWLFASAISVYAWKDVFDPIFFPVETVPFSLFCQKYNNNVTRI